MWFTFFSSKGIQIQNSNNSGKSKKYHSHYHTMDKRLIDGTPDITYISLVTQSKLTSFVDYMK